MKPIFLLLLTFTPMLSVAMPDDPSAATTQSSQTVPAATATQSDSISEQQLQEVVIEAPKVIRKADMELYHPSQSAVENSKNGLQLLNNLMIPTLTVSDALGTIQAAGQSVQVRINGRVSTIDNVRSLLPETIKRVNGSTIQASATAVRPTCSTS